MIVFPLDVYVLICLLFFIFLVAVIVQKIIRKTWEKDFWSLIVTCFGAATAISFLFGAIDKIFFQGRFFNMDVIRLAVAALLGSVGLTYAGLNRYLKYFGVDLERKKRKDKDSTKHNE